MAEMAGETHVVMGESSHNATEAFINRILERMEELESYWTARMARVNKDQEANAKMREELDELRTQYEYTDLKCTQLEDVACAHAIFPSKYMVALELSSVLEQVLSSGGRQAAKEI